MPDGSEHELRPLDHGSYAGSQDFLRGYFNVIPSGSPMRYYSLDGSFLYATISGNLNWTVYLPDGTRIIQTPDGVQRIQDTNGNKIKIFSDTNGTHFQDEQTTREIRSYLRSRRQRRAGPVSDLLSDSHRHITFHRREHGDDHCSGQDVHGERLRTRRRDDLSDARQACPLIASSSRNRLSANRIRSAATQVRLQLQLRHDREHNHNVNWSCWQF